MTEKQLGQLMAIMSGIWPKFEINTQKIILWHKIIGDISVEAAQKAVYKLANTNTFAPSIAEIRAASIDIKRPELKKSALEAWGEVQKIVNSISWNYYRDIAQEKIKELGAVTEKAARSIGYNELWNGKLEEKSFLQNKFIRIYDSLIEHDFNDERAPMLSIANNNVLLIKEGM
jgi:hypothetical protein